MRRIGKIIIHCSASEFGNAALIKRWHVESQGWKDIGYHYVIGSGYKDNSQVYHAGCNGLLELGRPEEVVGAHTKGYNEDSIGICLVGHFKFTYKQLFKALPELLDKLMETYGLSIGDVYGHYEFTDKKTCPNIDIEGYKKFLKERV